MNVHSPAMRAELDAYNQAMEKSLEDKLFFLEHTAGATTFVDFGCANGAILKAIHERRGPSKILIGIDHNPMQRAIAEQKVPSGVFVSDFELVKDRVAADDLGPKVAIFSSVIHEAPELLPVAVESGVFDYIVVRDMGITPDFARARAPRAWVDRVMAGAPRSAREFFDAGRRLHSMGDLTEFLLKSPYLGNSKAQTERELSENYPMVGELRGGHDADWSPVLLTHYSAPWVVDRIRHDFGFEFPFPTHFKLILKKVTV